MKKTVIIPLLVISLFLCACSLQYSVTEKDGAYSYACGEKKAFLYEYRWDGTEEGRIIDVPESFGGRKVAAVGGFFGRGLPMPFTIDVSEWLDRLPGEEPAAGASGEEVTADRTEELLFTVRIGANVEETHLGGDQTILRENGGVVTRYTVKVRTEKK